MALALLLVSVLLVSSNARTSAVGGSPGAARGLRAAEHTRAGGQAHRLIKDVRKLQPDAFLQVTLVSPVAPRSNGWMCVCGGGGGGFMYF
jgi:hypothetical protein